ncbi:MAG: DivIVA domain-containing protein, partial [Acidimicrobiales bacterium]
MADDRSPGSPPRVDAADVAGRGFSTVRRGFDPQEVRAYLELLAGALERANQREQELLLELQGAEDRARHPVVDESVLTSSLGQRSGAV